jgi:hypothetical protein
MIASFIQNAYPHTVSYGDKPPRSVKKSAGIAVSIFVHLLLLWLLLQPHAIVQKAKPRGAEMMFIAPLAAVTPVKPKTPQPKPKPKPKQAEIAAPSRAKPAVLAQREIAAPPPAVVQPPPDVIQREAPPADDMMAQIEAKRQRRADTQSKTPAESAPSEEDDNQRAKRVALANIAGLQGRAAGNQKEDSGGVFQIRNKGYHKAEFTFNGWNANFRRNWSQQILVEQGNDDDIETAIIRRMIELIRKYKDGEFQWESHRLGRIVSLNARPEHTQELQQFLMREFFPDYNPSPARR